MKEKIINDILSLKQGEKFTVGEYLKKYNIDDKKESFKLCFEIVKSLGENIKPQQGKYGGQMPIIGLPQNIVYIRQ